MDFKFSKGAGDQEMQEIPGEKKSQSSKLILLLLLVGGFSYVYFFTGLIRPQEAPKPPEAPVAQVVKMPLPAAPAPDQKSTGKAPAVPAVPATPAAPVTPAAPASVAKTAPPKPEKTVPAAVAVPVPKPAPSVPPKEDHKKAGEPKLADKKVIPPAQESKGQKTAVAKPDEKKAAESKKQPALVKSEPVKSAATATAAAAKKDKAVKTVAAKEGSAGIGGSWSVLVGHYSIEEALSADLGRVRKTGLEPVVKTGSRKKAAMNRLFLGEFSSKSEAQATLAKLKRQTSDAFVIESSGKYSVYAGSYLLDARAASEKERLGAAGFSVSIRHSEVAIPTQTLLVGPFADKKAAEAALAKLKNTGVKASLISQ